jgi:hypothetical protein
MANVNLLAKDSHFHLHEPWALSSEAAIDVVRGGSVARSGVANIARCCHATSRSTGTLIKNDNDCQ